MTTLQPWPGAPATGPTADPTDRRPGRGWLVVGLALAAVGIGLWTTAVVHQQFNNSVQFSQQTRSFTGTVRAVHISMSGGRVTIFGSANATTEVRAVTVSTDTLTPQDVEHLRHGILTLGSACRPGWASDCTVQYAVYVPTGTAVTVTLTTGTVTVVGVGDATLHTINGNIRVTRAEAVEAHTTTGSVSVTDATGPVTVSATDGNVTAVGVQGALAVTTTTGSVTARELNATAASVQADNGDVGLRFTVAPTDVTVTTVTGSVTVAVPTGSGPYKLEASPGTGRTTTTVATDPSSNSVVQVRTANGNIRFRYGS